MVWPLPSTAGMPSCHSSHGNDGATSPGGNFSLSSTRRETPGPGMVHAARGCERAGVMEITAFDSHDHQHNAGSGAVGYAGAPASAGRGNVTVAPTGATPGARGLRVQGMPWRRWLTTTPGRLRSASALLVIGLLVFAAVTPAATEARSRAAGAVATTSAPELITAENLYGNLA